jgi:triosephosphate isomerase
MEKIPFLVANWKMYPADADEAKALFSSVTSYVSREKPNATIVIAPPSVFTGLFGKSIKKNGKVSLAVQDVAATRGEGAYTGEVSAEIAKSIGVTYAIVGHSERRAAGETDEVVNKKLIASLEAGLTTILCVGEKERDEQGTYLGVLKTQVEHSLGNLPLRLFKKLVIAYEPVFAIGKDASFALSPREIHETVIFIRKVINDLSMAQDKKTNVQRIPVLYGGSVAPENVAAMYADASVDGFLIGHQSLDASAFKEIIKNVAPKKR